LIPQPWIDGFLPLKGKKTTSTPSPGPISVQQVPPSRDILSRAELYLDAIPSAIQGQNGSGKLYWAVNVLLWGFRLDEAMTKRMILQRYNDRCQPPWKEWEIDHKIENAKDNPPQKPAGWLLEEDRRSGQQNPDISALLEQMGIVLPKTPENRFRVWTLAELIAADLNVTFLIDDVLVQGQPMIIGGPKKCLKTSIMEPGATTYWLPIRISIPVARPFHLTPVCPMTRSTGALK
jgi:hypothetical protein